MTAAAPVQVTITGDSSSAMAALSRLSAGVKGTVSGVEGQFSKLNHVLDGFLAPIAAISAALGGGKMFKDAVTATVDMAKETTRLGNVLGVSAKEASVYRTAIGDIYGDVDTFLAGAGKITKTLGTNEDKFKKHGIATRDAHGALLPFPEILQNVNAKLESTKKGNDRNLLSLNLLGKSWQDWQKYIKLTPQLLDDAREKVDKLNLSLGPDATKRVADYRAAMNDVDDTLEALKVNVGVEVLPTLTKLGQWFADRGPSLIKGTLTVLQALTDAFSYSTVQIGFTIFALKTLSTVLKIDTLFIAMGRAIAAFTASASAGAGAMGSLTAAAKALMGPWGWALAAVVALGLGLEYYAGKEERSRKSRADNARVLGQEASAMDSVVDRLESMKRAQDRIQDPLKKAEQAVKDLAKAKQMLAGTTSGVTAANIQESTSLDEVIKKAKQASIVLKTLQLENRRDELSRLEKTDPEKAAHSAVNGFWGTGGMWATLTGSREEKKQAFLKKLREDKALLKKEIADLEAALSPAPVAPQEDKPEKGIFLKGQDVYARELEALRIAKAKELKLNTDYYELSKSREEKFWKDSLAAFEAQHGKTSRAISAIEYERQNLDKEDQAGKHRLDNELSVARARVDLENKVATARRATAQETLQQDKASHERVIEEAKADIQAKLMLQQEWVAKLRQSHAEESKEVQDALKAENTLKADLRNEDLKLEEIALETAREKRIYQADLELKQLEWEKSQGYVTERMYEDATFEALDRRLRAEEEFLRKRKALLIQYGVMTAEEAAKIKQEEARIQNERTLARAPQISRTTHREETTGAMGFNNAFDVWISGQKDKTPFDKWREVGLSTVNALQGGFATLFTNIFEHGMTGAQKWDALWKGISGAVVQALMNMAAQEVVVWGIEKARAAWKHITNTGEIKQQSTKVGATAAETAALGTQSGVIVGTVVPSYIAMNAAAGTLIASALTLASAETWAAYASIPFGGQALAMEQLAAMDGSIAAQVASAETTRAAVAFAKGGVIASPTLALMGEAGPEVVAPQRDFMALAGTLVNAGVNLQANIAQGQARVAGYQRLSSSYAQAGAQASKSGSGAGYQDYRGALIVTTSSTAWQDAVKQGVDGYAKRRA